MRLRRVVRVRVRGYCGSEIMMKEGVMRVRG